MNRCSSDSRMSPAQLPARIRLGVGALDENTRKKIKCESEQFFCFYLAFLVVIVTVVAVVYGFFVVPLFFLQLLLFLLLLFHLLLLLRKNRTRNCSDGVTLFQKLWGSWYEVVWTAAFITELSLDVLSYDESRGRT